ncbi:MAG: protein translocase subunit SecF [Candidatus Rokubacteria bacterium]|nr:protein translocase subunit SecF [Candidatus Rokubacteria bacterium]
MFQIFKDANYNFIGKRRWAYLLSVSFILLGLASVGVKGGLRYGIDFSGGTLIQARFDKAVHVDLIRSALSRIKLGESVIQEFGGPMEFIFRLPLADLPSEEVTRRVQEALAAEPLLGKAEIRRVEFVGPQVGRDLQFQALYAVLASAAGILIYIAIRFDFRGGVAAIVATFHDVLVTFSAMSLADREISLPVLAAFLTIIGYSVNDTIVAFDRVRENRGKGMRKGSTFAELINTAINQTLSRTVLTSLTTFMSAVVLLLFGGKVLEDFAFVLTVGVVTGTFSTIYVAGSILVDWNNWVETRARRAKKAVVKA